MILFWFCVAVMGIVFTIGGIVSALVWFADEVDRQCSVRRENIQNSKKGETT